jgi:hypothetical protein
MSQVIIHTNDNGGVSVTIPTGELDIQSTKNKDTPLGSIIVDASTLPKDADAQFFDAWELSGSTVTINLSKAKTIKLTQYNAQAIQEAQKRQLNTLTGIANDVSDIDFVSKLTSDRIAIANATSTAELLEI